MVKRIFFEHHTCYNPGDPAGISGAWQPGGFSSECPEHQLSSAALLGHAANLGLGAFPWLFFVLLHKKKIYLFFIKMKHLHHSKAVQHMLFKIKILRSSGENLGDELLKMGLQHCITERLRLEGTLGIISPPGHARATAF